MESPRLSSRRPAPAAAPKEPPERFRVAVALAAVLALLAVMNAMRETPRETVVVVATAPVGFPTPPLAQDSPASSPSWLEPAPKSEVRNAPTPKDLLERAVQSPDLPLRAEAHRLVRHCAFVLTPQSATPLVSPPPWMKRESVPLAEQAWQALAGRCQSLRGQPNLHSLRQQLDPVPLFTAYEASSTQSEPERQWLINQFAQHGGPALLWAGDALVAFVEARATQPDGDAFDTVDPEAVQIARCRFGEDCSTQSDAAQLVCLTSGACEGDVPQRVLAALGSRAARERVMRQANALTKDLVNGDLGRYGLSR